VTVHACGRVQGDPPCKRKTCRLASHPSERKRETTRSLTCIARKRETPLSEMSQLDRHLIPSPYTSRDLKLRYIYILDTFVSTATLQQRK
jgi:hypothetical protein